MRKIALALIFLLVAVAAMATVGTNPGRNEYTAGAGQTIFNYTFKIYASTDLNVYVTPVGQDPDDSADITTAYTVSGVGVDAGGSITLNSGTTSGDRVTIVSDIPTNRTIDYQFNGDFRPNVVNNDFDRAISLVKQLENTSVNTLAYQNSYQGGAGVLPDPAAGNVIGYDGSAQLTNLLLGVDGNSWDGLTDLGDPSIGKGSDLVAHTSTANTVTQTLNTNTADIAVNTANIAANSADNLRENVLIGGDISRNPAQMGATFNSVADNDYTLDQWRVQKNAASTINITKETLTEGTTGLGFEVTNSIRFTSVSGGNVSDLLAIIVEDVRTLSGKNVRIPVAIRGSASVSVAVQLLQVFDPSSDTTTVGVLSVTTSWQDLFLDYAIPSVAGETIGDDSYLAVNFVMDNLGAGEWVEISFAAMHEDSNDRTLERRTASEELALCKRYFERIEPQVVFGSISAGLCVTTTAAQIPVTYTEKRAKPDLSASSGGFQVDTAAGAELVTDFQWTDISFKSALSDLTVASGLVAGEACLLQFVSALNSFIDIDARL